MKKTFLALCACALLTGCGVTSAPITGLAYTDVISGQDVTGNKMGQKVGRAMATSYLGLVAMGDASYQTAAKNAGITKISHVDKRNYTILGLYTTYETIVVGE